MLTIRNARKDEFDKVRKFYYSLIDAMQGAEYKPGWQRDVYPSQQLLWDALCTETLYIGEQDGEVVSCMVVNHQYNSAYNNVEWSVNVSDDKLLVIHALGVHFDFSGKGLAKEMVKWVFNMAREKGIQVLRLDVLEGNLPAEKVYTAVGFKHIDTLQMFYEDTGWTSFKAYEYIL